MELEPLGLSLMGLIHTKKQGLSLVEACIIGLQGVKNYLSINHILGRNNWEASFVRHIALGFEAWQYHAW